MLTDSQTPRVATPQTSGADAIVIGGYGFGDAHVNSVLSNVLRQKEAARPPVMVLDYDNQRRQVEDQTPPVQRMFDQRSDGWAYRLREALAVGRDFAQSNNLDDGGTNGPMAVEQFESNSAARVAIWFGGFETAAGQIDEITRWLESGR